MTTTNITKFEVWRELKNNFGLFIHDHMLSNWDMRNLKKNSGHIYPIFTLAQKYKKILKYKKFKKVGPWFYTLRELIFFEMLNFFGEGRGIEPILSIFYPDLCLISIIRCALNFENLRRLSGTEWTNIVHFRTYLSLI